MRALARVDLGAIERNCARLAAVAAPARLCAVVKADGYGHGAVPAARAARAGGAAWLAVATAGEAFELRSAGIEGPLLVMGALSSAELDVALEARADIVAWREEFVASLPDGVGVHVKLDTGMGRLGTRDPDEASRVVAAAGDRIAGLMTHFATADEDDRDASSPSSWSGSSAGSPAIPASRSTRPTRPPRCASRPPASTSCAAASPSTAWTRSTATPPTTASSPRSSWSATSPRSSARCRARAPATAAASWPSGRPGSAPCRSATATASGARSPTTPTCSSTAAACRWWGPSRWTTSPSTSAPSRSSAAPRRC